MPSPPQSDSTQGLLEHFRSMKELVGDRLLRKMLSAERRATLDDPAITDADKQSLFQTLNYIEQELFGPSPSTS